MSTKISTQNLTKNFLNHRESTTQLYSIHTKIGNLQHTSINNNRTKFVRTWQTAKVCTEREKNRSRIEIVCSRFFGRIPNKQYLVLIFRVQKYAQQIFSIHV